MRGPPCRRPQYSIRCGRQIGDGHGEDNDAERRVSGALGAFVAANVGDDGAYENVSEYVRDLIRRDMSRADAEAFVRLKAELARAFAAPETTYRPLSADEVIHRNARRAQA